MASMANLRALEESYKSKETLEAGPLPSRAPTRIWPGESRSEWRPWLICGSLLEKITSPGGGTRRWEPASKKKTSPGWGTFVGKSVINRFSGSKINGFSASPNHIWFIWFYWSKMLQKHITNLIMRVFYGS